MLELVKNAKAALLKSYSPYSNYKVGACVLADDNKMYSGCNIENSSYSATICAERVAAALAVKSGAKLFTQIAIYSDSHILPYPCGVCLQFLSEFVKDDCLVILANSLVQKQYKFTQLFPKPFKLA